MFDKNIGGCKNNLENISTTRVGKHVPWGFSIPTTSPFKSIENMDDKECMKKVLQILKRTRNGGN